MISGRHANHTRSCFKAISSKWRARQFLRQGLSNQPVVVCSTSYPTAALLPARGGGETISKEECLQRRKALHVHAAKSTERMGHSGSFLNPLSDIPACLDQVDGGKEKFQRFGKKTLLDPGGRHSQTCRECRAHISSGNRQPGRRPIPAQEIVCQRGS